MTLNLTARYYWSYSDVKEFYTLQNNGEIVSNPTYTLNRNRNFNSWNFDLSHGGFAPGSEMSVLYRNYSRRETNVERNLNTNLKNVFDANLTNIISKSDIFRLHMVKNKF
jgi:hypothetical protein